MSKRFAVTTGRNTRSIAQPLLELSKARGDNFTVSPDEMPAERMFTVAEVAALFKFTPRTIRNWITDGRIHAIRFGRSIRIPETSLKALI